MDLFDNDIKVHNSRPPLRWFANICESIAGWAILHIAYLDEDNNFGIRYKMYSFVHSLTWPLANKYGTFYVFIKDLSGPEWDDYDEHGNPYWFYTEWQEDPETGDAWKLIKKGEK